MPAENNGNDSNKAKKKTFPELLHDLLDYASTEENQATTIVMWLPCGKAFAVLEPQKFEQDVLPRFFPQSQYSSFTRKLNRWGFRQVVKGPNRGAFHNDMFRRDSPNLCLQMSCIKARKPRALELYHKYGSVASGSASTFGTDASAPSTGHNTLMADGIEEMLRHRQRELELQKSKLNAELAMLESDTGSNTHPMTPVNTMRSSCWSGPRRVSPDGSLDRPRVGMTSENLGQQPQRQLQLDPMNHRLHSALQAFEVSDNSSEGSVPDDELDLENLELGLQDFFGDGPNRSVYGCQWQQQQQQGQRCLVQHQQNHRSRFQLHSRDDTMAMYNALSQSERNLASSLLDH